MRRVAHLVVRLQPSVLPPKSNFASMMTLSRRIILQGLLASVAVPAWAQQQPTGVPTPTPFRFEDVVRRARELASAPYEAVPSQLPEPLNALSFDDYRDIRFRPERALLASGCSCFTSDFSTIDR